MRRNLAIILCIGVLMGAAPTKEGGNKGDNELDGDWCLLLEKTDLDGHKIEDIPVGLTFKGTQLTLTVPTVTIPSPRSSDVPIKIDSVQNPKHIDFRFGDQWVKCLYEVKRDTLRICVNTKTEERPKKFEANKEKGYDILVLKRVPKQG